MTDQRFHMAYMDTCGPQTMLMLHGFPLNNNMWAPQYDDLYDLARIISPDLPGHGTSDPYHSELTVPLMAELCADLLDKLDIKEPVVLCGLSMGGYVAFEFLRQFPNRVKALILTATKATADTEEGKSKRNAAISKIKKKGMEPFIEEQLKMLLSDSSAEENPELVNFLRELMQSVPPEGAIAALNAMKNRADSTDLLPKIDIPTLLLFGDEDKIISPDEATALQTGIPHADLYFLERAGHLPNIEEPDLFNGLVAEFLADLI